MVEYLSGGRIQGSSTLTTTVPNTGWKVLGRDTGGSSTMDSGTFTAKDNLMILIFATAGTEMLTFNGQSSSGNFANRRIEENQSGDGSEQTDQNNVNFSRNVGEDMFIVGTINNVSGAPKLGIFHNVSDNVVPKSHVCPKILDDLLGSTYNASATVLSTLK